MKYSPRADELYRRLLIATEDKDICDFSEIASLPSVEEIMAEKKAIQRDFVFLTFGLRYLKYDDRYSNNWPECFHELYDSLPNQRPAFSKVPVHVAARLIRRNLPFTMPEYAWLADCCARTKALDQWSHPHIEAIIKRIKGYLKISEEQPDYQLKQSLSGLAEALLKLNDEDAFPLIRTLQTLSSNHTRFPLKAGEAWSDRALDDGAQMPAPLQNAWGALLSHCQTASAGKPSAKWQKTATPLIAEIGEEEFTKTLLEWFPLVDKPRTQPLNQRHWGPDPNLMLIDLHTDTLKGLVWCCSLVDDAKLARALSALAISTYKKVPGVGPRATKVGNACVWSLGQIPSQVALGQLAFLKVKVKFGTAQKGIEKALNATAERMNVPRDEIEEMGFPPTD